MQREKEKARIEAERKRSNEKSVKVVLGAINEALRGYPLSLLVC